MATDLSQDQGFQNASSDDQHAYLMATDPGYAKAPPDDQKAYREHVTNITNPEAMLSKAQGQAHTEASAPIENAPRPHESVGLHQHLSTIGGGNVEAGRERQNKAMEPVNKGIEDFAAGSSALIPGAGEETIPAMLGTAARTYVGGAAGGAGGAYLGKKIGGRFGETAGDVGEVAGGLGGGLLGGYLGNAGMTRALRGPGGTEPVSINPATWIQRELENRVPRTSTPTSIGTSIVPEEGATVVPEPRPLFPGENPNYMASVPREEELPEMAQRGKPGAAKQMQQIGKRIIYEPRPTIGRR